MDANEELKLLLKCKKKHVAGGGGGGGDLGGCAKGLKLF